MFGGCLESVPEFQHETYFISFFEHKSERERLYVSPRFKTRSGLFS